MWSIAGRLRGDPGAGQRGLPPPARGQRSLVVVDAGRVGGLAVPEQDQGPSYAVTSALRKTWVHPTSSRPLATTEGTASARYPANSTGRQGAAGVASAWRVGAAAGQPMGLHRRFGVATTTDPAASLTTGLRFLIELPDGDRRGLQGDRRGSRAGTRAGVAGELSVPAPANQRPQQVLRDLGSGAGVAGLSAVGAELRHGPRIGGSAARRCGAGSAQQRLPAGRPARRSGSAGRGRG